LKKAVRVSEVVWGCVSLSSGAVQSIMCVYRYPQIVLARLHVEQATRGYDTARGVMYRRDVLRCLPNKKRVTYLGTRDYDALPLFNLFTNAFC
jgi:hypothetical protein